MLRLKKRITYKVLIIAVLLAASVGLKAQQVPIFTNHANSYAYANPGFAGMSEGINLLGLYRMQWAGFVDNDGKCFLLVALHLLHGEGELLNGCSNNLCVAVNGIGEVC